MTIDRRQIFTLAWKRAKAHRDGYRTLRAAFAASLRAVWALAKATVAADAQAKAKLPVWDATTTPSRPRPVTAWEKANPHRAAAVAAARARLGTYTGFAGW